MDEGTLHIAEQSRKVGVGVFERATSSCGGRSAFRAREVEETRGTDGGSRAGRDINDRDGEVEDDDASERETKPARKRESESAANRKGGRTETRVERVYVCVCVYEREREKE